MNYFVTYCATDKEVGSNPMWHSCLLLSVSDESKNQMKVVDNWGFYGLPTTTKGFSLIRKIKLLFGLDVDLVGNHGMLRHEEIRYLDAGRGLHGTTFQLTQEQFNTLEKNCKQMERDQDQAIKDYVEPRGLKGKPPEETRIYPYEDISPEIFRAEKEKAAQEHREPRLQPFELNPSFNLRGLGFETAHTCKSQAIKLLSTVLTQQQIDRLTENGHHPTVPRFSGKMEDIYLHSSGPLRVHTKKSGEQVFYRDAQDADVALYWTLPPQELEATEETMKRFKLDEQTCVEIKTMIRKLQGIEWVLRNSKASTPESEPIKQELIKHTIEQYTQFFNINPWPLALQVLARPHFRWQFFAHQPVSLSLGVRAKLANAASFCEAFDQVERINSVSAA